jgi:hypothetical protein
VIGGSALTPTHATRFLSGQFLFGYAPVLIDDSKLFQVTLLFRSMQDDISDSAVVPQRQNDFTRMIF